MKSSKLFIIVCAIACCIFVNNAQVQSPAVPETIPQAPDQTVNPAPAPAQPANPAPAPAQPVNPAAAPVQPANPDPASVPAQPANPAPAPVQPANPDPASAPAQPANPAPAPAQPANPASAPAQPANPAPAQPANPDPASVPAQPANPDPAQPANPAPAPAQPANPDPASVPAQPANPAPAQPANPAPAPAQPANPAPAQPANPAPAPAQPANPDPASVPAQPANPAPAPAQPANPDPASVPAQPANPAPAPAQPANPDPASVPAQPANPDPASVPAQPANPAPAQPANPAPAPAQPANPDPASVPAQPANPDQVEVQPDPQTKTVDTQTSIKGLTLDEVCSICDCPATILENPYIINCTFLSLNDSHAWSPVVLEVDNVHLLLNHNQFKVIPVMVRCDVLDAIDFSNNEISEIADSAFSNLPNLKQLLLAHNRLEHISSEAFHTENLPLNIEILDLSYNQIDSLHNDAFNQLPHLKKLVLAGNPFDALDSATQTALNNLKELEELNMAATGLKELPWTLINPIRHLQILNLSDNRFKIVPEILQGSQLTELIFSGNLIVELLPSSFIEMSNLKVLEVNHCPNLTAIRKGTLFPLTALTTFRCNDNPKLKVIERRAFRDENGEGPKQMNAIELRNNSLSSLSEDLFKHIGLVIEDTLDATDNPFNCTCHLEWLTKEGPASIYLKDMKCTNPPQLQGFSLDQLDFSSSGQLPCPDDHDEEVVAHFTYVVSESYGFWIFVLVIGLIVIISVSVYIIRSKPQLRYSILKVVSPSRVQYREDEAAASKVKYTRQLNDDYEDPFNGLDMDLEIYKR